MGDDLAKILQPEGDTAIHAVSDQLALGIAVVIHRLQGEEADLCRLGRNAVGAQNASHLLGGAAGSVIRRLCGLFLSGNVELHQRRIGRGLVLSVRSHVDGIGLGCNRGVFLGCGGGGQQKCHRP